MKNEKTKSKKNEKQNSKKIILLLLFGILSFLSFQVLLNAEQLKISKFYLTPFYLFSASKNVNISYVVEINPSESISSNVYSLLNFELYSTAPVTFKIWVNGQECSTSSFSVPATFGTMEKMDLSFDCSNIIQYPAKYNITLQSSEDLSSITSNIDFAYFDNPQGQISVHGTEYTYGQVAKAWLQLLANNGTSIENGVCFIDIYTPSQDYLVERATMTNMHHDGIYYYDLNVPIIQGVYPVIATCYYQASQLFNFANNFFVLNGTLNAGVVSNTYTIENTVAGSLQFKEEGAGNPRRLQVGLNFTNQTFCTNVSELLLSGISINVVGRFDSAPNDDLTISLWNYTSNSWIDLSNKLLEGNVWRVVGNNLEFNNITKAGIVNSSGSGMRLRFLDTTVADGTTDTFELDYADISCNILSNPQWQEIKGSSELHVSSDNSYIADLSGDSFNISNNWITTLANGTNISEIYYTGIFKHKFTIVSGTYLNQSINIEYQGLHSIPCNSIMSFYFINNTGYYPYPFTTQRQTTEDHCSINFNLNISQGQNYNFEVHARNTWESEIRSTNTGVGAIYPLVNAGCLLWQQVKSYPAYIIPKNQTNEPYDYYYRACANWYDDFYWFNKTYYQSLTDKNLIIDEPTYLQYESDYTSLKFAEDKLNSLTSLLLENLLAVGQYSKLLIDNPLGNLTNTTDQQYWGSHSTIYLNWLLINSSCGTGICKINGTELSSFFNITVNINDTDGINYTLMQEFIWNATNRSLTFYPVQTDMTNYTNIFSGLWGWTGNVSSSLLNYFTNAIWSGNNRTLTSFNFDMTNYTKVAEYVWLNDNRTLTFYPSQIDMTNYTLINSLINNRNDIVNYTLINQLINDRNDIVNYTLINSLIQDLNTSDKTNYTLIYDLIHTLNVTDYTNYTLINELITNRNDIVNYTLINQIVNSLNVSDKTNYTLINSLITNRNDIVNYTYLAQLINNDTDLTNYTLIQSLISFYSNNLTAQAIWEYGGDRNLTYYYWVNQTDMTNYSLISQYVWNYQGERNLTLYMVNNISASDIWSFMNRSLTFYMLNNFTNNITAFDIWNYSNRGLTENISEMVWNYFSRNLTNTNLGNNLSAQDIWNYVNISQSSDIPFLIWNYDMGRNLTENISFEIWQYYNRTLTFYPSINYTELSEFLSNFSNSEVGIPPDSIMGLMSFSLFVTTLNATLSVPSYPFVDVNTTYPMVLTSPQTLNASIYITELNGSLSKFNFVPVGSHYDLSLLFDTIGDYPFVINDSTLIGDIRGTLLVRNPFNVTICGYQQKTGAKYKNDFAYLTAEYLGNKKYNFNLEQFIVPIGFKYTFKTPVFHTLYQNGCGTLKLYDANETYLLRIFDGQVTYESTYAPPNITKGYGSNILLGKQFFNGTSQSYNYYLSEKDIHPYFWLMNILFIIGILGVLIISIFMFFVMSDRPSFVLIFFIIGIVGLIIGRLIIYLWIG